MSLAVREQAEDYCHFNDFFTRALKVEKRPIDNTAKSIVSPVDGHVSEFGDIQRGQIVQAKKINYSLPALLGGSAALALRFDRGKFATFYLSPKDYHRVHSPFVGTLQEMIYVPGRLFSVNKKTTEQLDRLFVKNERVICLFSTPVGPMAVIMVGAMLVGSISTVWEGMITPADVRKTRHWYYTEDTVCIAKGEEIGRFHLGSTVILLFAENCVQWSSQFTLQSKVQFGKAIGQVLL